MAENQPGSRTSYKELDVIPLPEDVPELGLSAGYPVTVVDIYPDGTLVVDASDEEGRTLDLLDIEPDPAPRISGRWHLGSSIS